MKRLRLVCVVGSAFAFMGIGSTATASDPVPPDMVGFYYQHAGGMKVRSNGTIRVSYQWYYKRDKGLPTFPRMTLVVDQVDGRTLRGRVVAESKSPVRVGARFVAKQQSPGMRLRVAGSSHRWRFCDDAHPGECGA